MRRYICVVPGRWQETTPLQDPRRRVSRSHRSLSSTPCPYACQVQVRTRIPSRYVPRGRYAQVHSPQLRAPAARQECEPQVRSCVPRPVIAPPGPSSCGPESDILGAQTTRWTPFGLAVIRTSTLSTSSTLRTLRTSSCREVFRESASIFCAAANVSLAGLDAGLGRLHRPIPGVEEDDRVPGLVAGVPDREPDLHRLARDDVAGHRQPAGAAAGVA